MNTLSLVNNTDSLKNLYVDQNFNGSKHSFVFSTDVHPGCSDKYVAITTADILAEVYNQIGSFEWEVLRQGKSRRGLTHTKAHIVAIYFEPKDAELKSYGKFALYIINSMDRSKALTISYGWLNGACLNGCIFGELVLEKFTQRHIGDKAKNIHSTVQELVMNVKSMLDSGLVKELETIKRMTKTKISMAQFEDMAKKALELRISHSNLKNLDTENGETYSYDANELEKVMQSIRPQFDDLTLWNGYNIVHENLGGNFDDLPSRASKKIELPKISMTVTRLKDNQMVSRNASIRKFNDINAKVDFNTDLIQLATSYLSENTQMAA
jgi:hypothetical protein